MNLNFNMGGSSKSCTMGHPLTLVNGAQRGYPRCNGCGAMGLQSAYTC